MLIFAHVRARARDGKKVMNSVLTVVPTP